MKVLCYDPSGNTGKEGNGTTGYAIFSQDQLYEFGDVKSTDYDSREYYWFAVGNIITLERPDIVICEDYRLFSHKAQQQSWSKMETPQLIGYLRMICWHKGTKFIEQSPSDKTRVADPQLVTLDVLQKKGNRYTCLGRQTNLHQRDAIRHGVFWHRYRKERDLNEALGRV